jgi:hypothetical protein
LLSLGGSNDPFRDLPNLAVVRIRRRDRLGQAISPGVRARQTVNSSPPISQEVRPA